MRFAIECIECVNYSLIHSGLQQIIYEATVPQGTTAAVRVPGFSVADLYLPEGQTSDVSPMLDSARFAALSHPAEAQLISQCSNGEELLRNIWVLPMRAWDQRREFALATAAFVLENDPFVLRVLRKAEANPCTTLSGVATLHSLKRIYEAAVSSLECRYLFDRGVLTGFNSEQYVRFPSQVEWDMGGSCIDLVLFFSAAALAVQLRPVVILTGNEDSVRHALLGLWHADSTSDAVVPASVVQRQAARGKLVALESTWITQDRSFEDALEEGTRRISGNEVLWGVDVQAARLGMPQVHALPEAWKIVHTGHPAAITDRYTTTRVETAVSLVSGLRLEVSSRRSPDDLDRHWNLRGYAVTIGRSPHNLVQLADVTVSREHAVVFVKDDALYIKDLASAAGTSVDGKRLEPHLAYPIHAGCSLQIGMVELRLSPRKQQAGKDG